MAGWIVSNLLIPVIMILCGFHWWKHTPKNINGLVGFRTGRSMKNKDTWLFANQYSGKRMWYVGWVTLILSVIVQFPFLHSDYLNKATNTIILVQFVVVIEIIYATQKALEKNFTENGRSIGKKYKKRGSR